MGLTRQQQVGTACNMVAHFTLRERLQVLWALLTRRAT